MVSHAHVHSEAMPALQEVFRHRCRLPPATAGNALVAMADLSEWMPWRAEAETLLSAAERERVARKRRPQDREQLILAYALHRLFLAAIWRIAPQEVPLGRDAEGRPRLGDRGGRTSLSHAAGAAAFAFCSEGVVGIDVESRERIGAMAEIAGQVAHPDELARLAMPPARDEHLLALWVRKEAFLKAVGVGLVCEMNGFHAAEGAVLETRLAESEYRDCEGTEALRVQTLPLHAGFLLAVAAPPALRVEAIRLSPH
ncbi:4'-phosphopantetheinyl transferase family protein [Pseudoxanthomonas putridarboris]|uniref:4'-phosphopantetheinyl transferase superfamily protein n=1 Tax=Pseudoxanthomonas putridarboris TaxID=752605 RepID=A0ABU9IYB4_9GAMM